MLTLPDDPRARFRTLTIQPAHEKRERLGTASYHAPGMVQTILHVHELHRPQLRPHLYLVQKLTPIVLPIPSPR